MGLLHKAVVRRGFGVSRILAYCAVLLANYSADRITKLLAVRHLKDAPSLFFLDGLVILSYAENGGAFLSLGTQWAPALKVVLFIVLPLIGCVAGFVFACRKSTEPLQAVSVLCIIGGGVGNLQDRILGGGRVVDFMNFGIGPLRTGILNVGDLSVTFGALALILLVYGSESKRKKP